MKNFKKLLALSLAVLTFLFSFTACSNSNTSSSQSNSDIKASTVEDKKGDTLEVPDSIDRIISLSASNTEILTGLGLSDKIVAADIFSADAGVDSSVAVLDMQNPDIEKIASLNPDVIFVNGINTDGASNPYSELKKTGTDVIYIPAAASLDDIKSDIKLISEYTKTEEKGNQLIKSIDDKIKEITNVGIEQIGIDSRAKKKVYFELSAAPYCYSFGKGTFLNEILDLLGVENIYGSQDGWLSITEEDIISKNPDIILSSVKYDGYDISEIAKRPGWENVNAVKNNKITYVDTNSVSRASQNIVKGMDEIKKAIYPDAK